jgi:hypothetical protein
MHNSSIEGMRQRKVNTAVIRRDRKENQRVGGALPAMAFVSGVNCVETARSTGTQFNTRQERSGAEPKSTNHQRCEYSNLIK